MASPAPRSSGGRISGGGGRRSGGGVSSSDAPASPPRAALPEGSFLTRQGAHASASAARASAAKAAAQPPFTPQFADDPAAVLAASPRLKARLSETEAERVQRLSVTEPAAAAAKREQRSKSLLAAEAPFRPEVTAASRKLAPKGAGVAELYGNARGAKAAAAAKQRYEAHLQVVAPFRPDTAASRQSRHLYAEASAMPRVASADAETLGRRIKALQQARTAAAVGAAAAQRPLTAAHDAPLRRPGAAAASPMRARAARSAWQAPRGGPRRAGARQRGPKGVLGGARSADRARVVLLRKKRRTWRRSKPRARRKKPRRAPPARRRRASAPHACGRDAAAAAPALRRQWSRCCGAAAPRSAPPGARATRCSWRAPWRGR